MVTVASTRGDREQFLLVPVVDSDDDNGNDDDDDAQEANWDGNGNAAEREGLTKNAGLNSGVTRIPKSKRKDMFYIRSYKFNRYLTSDSTTGMVSTIDFSQKKKNDNNNNNHNGQQQQQQPQKIKPGKEEKWILLRSPHGGHFIVSAKHEKNIACHRGGEAITIGLAGGNDRSESWEVEFVSGELCFLSSDDEEEEEDVQQQHQQLQPRKKQVRCDLMGKLTLTNDKRGWEVWRFVEMGGGKLRIVSWMHPFCIVCTRDGKASTITIGKAEEAGHCDEWTIEKAPEGYTGVVVRSAGTARKVLSRGEGGIFIMTQELDGGNGVWRLDAAHSQTYTLTSSGRAGDRSMGPFPYVTENAKQSDHIALQQVDDEGTVRLYHKSLGRYLRACAGCEVRCDPTPPDDADASDLWKMEQRPADGGYTFSSKLHGEFLAYTADEVNPKLCTTVSSSPSDDGREVWRVDPILPRAVSSAKIKTFALGTSIAVGTTVAMPFLMAGMLAVVPAEATLAASILSVGLTSAEAIASVGAIGATAAIVFREESDTLGMESEHEKDGEEGEDYTKRPLCGWRSW